MSITFSSCFYIIKSKFDPSTYINWMNNFISIVNNFNLVIYTDENSSQYINVKGNPKIKVIINTVFFLNNKNFLSIKISKRINTIKDLIKFDLSPVTKTEKGTKIKNRFE